MAHQSELDKVYMDQALLYSKLSKAVRAKVGCTLVTSNGVTVSSYNGTPAGYDNKCEGIDMDTGELYTLNSVVHSEMNTIAKCAREGVSTLGAKIYISLAPCARCAAVLVQAGIKEVIYSEDYRDTEGLSILSKSGVKVRQFKERD